MDASFWYSSSQIKNNSHHLGTISQYRTSTGSMVHCIVGFWDYPLFCMQTYRVGGTLEPPWRQATGDWLLSNCAFQILLNPSLLTLETRYLCLYRKRASYTIFFGSKCICNVAVLVHFLQFVTQRLCCSIVAQKNVVCTWVHKHPKDTFLSLGFELTGDWFCFHRLRTHSMLAQMQWCLHATKRLGCVCFNGFFTSSLHQLMLICQGLTLCASFLWFVLHNQSSCCTNWKSHL